MHDPNPHPNATSFSFPPTCFYTYHGKKGERAPFVTTDLLIHPDATLIHDGAFIGRRFLQRVTMHDNITAIGKYAFSGCTSLQPFALSRNLKVIGKFAFNRCHSLETVYFPLNLREIGHKAFRDCGALRICHIPDIHHTCTSIADFHKSSDDDTDTDTDTNNVVEDIIDTKTEVENEVLSPALIGNINKNCTRTCGDIDLKEQQRENEGEKVVVKDGAFALCYRLLTTDKCQYSWDDDTGACTNNNEIHTWLQRRHDHCPLHKVCYQYRYRFDGTNENITSQSLLRSAIHKYGAESASLTDDQQMTAMHILAANPNLTININTVPQQHPQIQCQSLAFSPSESASVLAVASASFQLLYEANPEALFARDKYGCTPLFYLCKYNPSVLETSFWLRNANCKGCLEIGDEAENITPLYILMKNDNLGRLPLAVAICQGIRWLEPVVDKNLERDGQILNERDRETGLHWFMLAAVGGCSDLPSVYYLLKLTCSWFS